GAVRQRETTIEQAMRALDARQLAVLLARFRLALALDRENALLHRDLDILRIDAGNVGEDGEAVVLFLDVDARRPLTGDDVRLIGLLIGEKTVEHVPDFILEIAAVDVPRAVTGNSHASSPQNGVRRKCRVREKVGPAMALSRVLRTEFFSFPSAACRHLSGKRRGFEGVFAGGRIPSEKSLSSLLP